MWRAILSLFMVLLLADVTEAAKRKKAKKKKAKAATKTEKVVRNDESEPEEVKTTEAKEPESAAGAGNEMDAYRAIQNRPEVTVQDLADLLLMYRSEYGKYKDAKGRLARARELALIQDHQGDEKLDRGTLAYAIMKVYHPEQGLLYWLTGWERYALRDVQEAGILPAKSAPGHHLSGEQLFAIMTDAEEFVTKKREWQNKEQPK
ncbi:MAG: hypothetical protein U1F27_17965 [Turneriella sp.]